MNLASSSIYNDHGPVITFPVSDGDKVLRSISV